MYISLKWKLVVFLSLVLVVTTALWTWQSISQHLENFADKLRQAHSDQNALLLELVGDSFLKLSQFSQLVAEKQVIQENLDKKGGQVLLKQALERNWPAYNINLGLDYLEIFNDKNLSQGQVASPELKRDQAFHNTIINELQSRQSDQQPKNFIYCASACLLVVQEPFIGKNGQTGTIVVAQNMADIVRIYFNFSKSGLGVLIAAEKNQPSLMPKRYLRQWEVNAWAVSDFHNIFPVLKAQASEFPLDTTTNDQFLHVNEQVFLVKSLELPEWRILGCEVHFVSVSDETAGYTLMRTNIKRGLFIGFLGLLGAEAVLLFLLISPMNKLLNITKALHLLPHQEFSRAVDQVTTKNTLFSDELTTLENSTAFVAQELEKLHIEINDKNQSLEEQIHALTRSRSFMTRLFDNAQIFIVTQKHNFNIRVTNKKFDGLYHHTPKNFGMLFSDDTDMDVFRRGIDSLKSREKNVFRQEVCQFDKDGNEFIIAWTHALVENEEGDEIILSIGMDHTTQKKAEHDLRWMANHDSLTGMGNRRFFNTAFSQFLNTDMHGALVFIDVNRFKQINDIYGHSAGDQVLVDISRKLSKLLRNSDVICRFAGDEFTAILTNVKAESLPPVLDKISRELSGAVKTARGRSVNYSVSIGVSVFPDHGSEAQTLVINADMAMYNAKRKGVGYWHIFDANDEQIIQLKKDNSLILCIKNALKNNGFKLVFQPIINIETKAIVHYEALVRMMDENGQMISPGLFIPVAERSGEIRSIDEWVLDNALSQLSSLAPDSFYNRLAINISAPTMQADDFPQMIFDAVGKYNVAPERLIIELTETAYIENFQQVLRNLKQIAAEGIEVALDDFGVGFSSFTHLKKLPLSYVKLDGSYVRNLVKNSADQVFVKSLAAIISAYGMKTIAEFIEDEETLELLASLGVRYGQGYYLGRPDVIGKKSTEKNHV